MFLKARLVGKETIMHCVEVDHIHKNVDTQADKVERIG